MTIREKSKVVSLRGPAGYHKVTEKDESGHAVTIDTDHHLVHVGRYFIVDDIDIEVDIAAPKIWYFETPDDDTRIHIYFQGSVSNAGTFELFEGGSVSVLGSAVSPTNLDRNSTRESKMNFYRDSTVGDLGTFRMGVFLGGASPTPVPIGGSADRRTEMILKKAEKYIVRFSPVNNDTVVNISFKWYEAEYPSDDIIDP